MHWEMRTKRIIKMKALLQQNKVLEGKVSELAKGDFDKKKNRQEKLKLKNKGLKLNTIKSFV